MLASRGKPSWLKILPPTEKFPEIKGIARKYSLHTVCEEAHCPNMAECWSGGTATFMVLGDTCTRGCKFCAVKTFYKPPPPDPSEPANLARAVAELKLDYIVITSVDRDDLPDQGASHFAQCIRAVKEADSSIVVEVLIPDFRGQQELVDVVINAKPDVIAHNIETVKRLQQNVRDPRAGYDQSLGVLRYVKETSPATYTKSSLMLGFGEQDKEVIEAMQDLRATDVDILTFGQYLRPGAMHLPVQEYVHPDKFSFFGQRAEAMGFLYCASGPFVRSSYRAAELFTRALVKKARLQ
ncbi:MAG: lipoyl synthase [Candidatus Aenigmarchaeota archaeon]|nr:lipoyl synthase [Candidatus Aenigmarchaeota archaeon]